MVKPHAKESIQYRKLIGNQYIFRVVWLIFTLVLYIFTSYTIHDGTLCCLSQTFVIRCGVVGTTRRMKDFSICFLSGLDYSVQIIPI